MVPFTSSNTLEVYTDADDPVAVAVDNVDCRAAILRRFKAGELNLGNDSVEPSSGRQLSNADQIDWTAGARP